ncbi:MAG: helix-turn-helix domain-containing protein [Candidatus Eisenbacteria bacterium]
MTAAVSDSGRATADAVRGHLDVLGPVSVAELSHRLQLSRGTIQSALAALEAQGTVLRGRFRAEIPGVTDGDVEEFCDRRLLARIHRYTLDRLRREIEPQTVQEYLRFLIKWQHVSEVARLEGKRGLLEAIGQLQGFEAPAMAWERELLPARVKDYDPEWLDELCLSGAVTWLRPSLRSAHVERDGSDGDRPVKATAPANVATPISLVLRRDLTSFSRAFAADKSRTILRTGPRPTSWLRCAGWARSSTRTSRGSRDVCPRMSRRGFGSWSRAVWSTPTGSRRCGSSCKSRRSADCRAGNGRAGSARAHGSPRSVVGRSCPTSGQLTRTGMTSARRGRGSSCGAMEWFSAMWSSARASRCRGGRSCVLSGGWRREERSAADASSSVSTASNTPCRRRSRCSGISAGRRRPRVRN